MLKRNILVILAVLAVLTSCMGAGKWKSDCDGHAYDVEGMTVFDLHGDWHQMGRQYGALVWEKMVDVLVYLDLKMGNDFLR